MMGMQSLLNTNNVQHKKESLDIIARGPQTDTELLLLTLRGFLLTNNILLRLCENQPLLIEDLKTTFFHKRRFSDNNVSVPEVEACLSADDVGRYS